MTDLSFERTIGRAMASDHDSPVSTWGVSGLGEDEGEGEGEGEG